MTHDQVRLALERHWFENFTQCVTEYQNASFTEAQKEQLEFDGAWARLSIRPILSETAGVAARKVLEREVGNIWVQVFTRQGEGTQRALEIAQAAKNLISHKRINAIRTYGADVRPGSNASTSLGVVDVPTGVRDGWYQMNVVARYVCYNETSIENVT